MRMTKLIWLGLAIVLTATAGCGPEEESNNVDTSEQFFELVREREPYRGDAADQEAVDALQAANTAAAFRFYRLLRTESSNLVFSPLSFSRVFAGYFDGLHEAQAFEALFGFTTEVATKGAWDQLFQQATDRDAYTDTPVEERSQFTSADIYWVDVASEGGADWEYFDRVHRLELRSEPEASRALINGWVEKKSAGMLTDFLTPGIINRDTVAVATNLVYFLGAWTTDFQDAGSLSFQALSGATNVSSFEGTNEMRASVTDDVTSVRIPYAHGYNHWVFMPTQDFETFANTLDESSYAALKASTSDAQVTLTVPEFSAVSDPNMVKAINTIRTETGTEGGTLTGAISESYLHKAAIEVTKDGTRAAAVSAVVEYLNGGPGPEELHTIVLDKPFVHVIEDANTGSILFMGEYTGPE